MLDLWLNRAARRLADSANRSRGAGALLNGFGIALLGWIGVVAYWWWKNREPFRSIAAFWRGYPTGPFAAFLVCSFIGVVPLAVLTWLIWRLFLRR